MTTVTRHMFPFPLPLQAAGWTVTSAGGDHTGGMWTIARAEE
jgi:hypothetical protein